MCVSQRTTAGRILLLFCLLSLSRAVVLNAREVQGTIRWMVDDDEMGTHSTPRSEGGISIVTKFCQQLTKRTSHV